MKQFQVLFLGSVFEGPVGFSALQATQVAGNACTYQLSFNPQFLCLPSSIEMCVHYNFISYFTLLR